MDVVPFVVGAALAGGFALWVTRYNASRGFAEPAITAGVFVAVGLTALVLSVRAGAGAAGIGAGLLAVSAYAFWWNQQRIIRRVSAAAALAQRLGLKFSGMDSRREVGLLVKTLQPGGTVLADAMTTVEDMIEGNLRGVFVRVFEYSYALDAGGRGIPAQHPFICAMAETPAAATDIRIRPATLARRLDSMFHERAVDLGDDTFKKLFLVQCDDPAAARARLDGRIRSWLAANGKGMSFLIGRNSVVGMSPRDSRAPSAVLDTVLAFRAQLYPDL